MIEIRTNIKEVSARLLKKLSALNTPEVRDKLSRTIAISLAGEMRERIHEKGQDSSGSQIGTYPQTYINRRVKKYNRLSDPKVILSLTRQMENDFTLGANNPEPAQTNKGYGIGFKNHENFLKSQYCETHYGKPIYKTTADEKGNVKIIAEEFVHKQLN